MTEMQKKEIARFSVAYLKKRMMINQELISKDENKIDFETFMAEYNKFEKWLEFAEKYPDKINEIDEFNVPFSFSESVFSLEKEFISANSNSIVLTENEIDELMGYIKESIEKYGVRNYGLRDPEYKSNETFFIRKVLDTLVNEMAVIKNELEIEKLKRIEKFRSYFYLNDNTGFCRKIQGRIGYEYPNFYISTHNYRSVCKINENGINNINELENNELENEEILIADKIYVGILSNNKSKIYVFLEKIVNGQRKMKAILHDNGIYDIADEKNQTDCGAIIFDKINDFFAKRGAKFLASNIYTDKTFAKTLCAYNNFCKLTRKKRKKMNNIVEIAISWWADKLSSQPFDNEVDNENCKNLNLLGQIISSHTLTLNEKRIQKFKTILENKIKVKLLYLNTNGLYLDNYSPRLELYEAIKEAQLNEAFTLNTIMDITMDEIKVRQGCNGEEEVIYSSNPSNKSKK